MFLELKKGPLAFFLATQAILRFRRLTPLGVLFLGLLGLCDLHTPGFYMGFDACQIF